jgi:hypothetical protein
MSLPPLLIVGRGESAHKQAHSDTLRHSMAVSSGIFMFGQGNPPEHFCTLDSVKFFQAGLWTERNHGWQYDENARQWPFWANENIAKHVASTRVKPGTYRTLPPEIYDVIPEYAMLAFNREHAKNTHLFGFQPNWGDYSNVQGWPIDTIATPSFGDGPIGLGECFNSLIMAVQVAHRLGYQDLEFTGCDLLSGGYKQLTAILAAAYPAAQAAGMDWVSLSPQSRLNEFLPVVEGVIA